MKYHLKLEELAKSLPQKSSNCIFHIRKVSGIISIMLELWPLQRGRRYYLPGTVPAVTTRVFMTSASLDSLSSVSILKSKDKDF